MGNSTNPFLKSPFDDILGDAPALPAQNQSERRPSTDGTSDLLPPEKYRPLFDAAAKKYGVPESDIMALAQQESGYDPDAIGTSTPYGHAKGMLQYLDDTANNLGINQFDPEASIDAAARQYAQRIKQGYSPDEALMAHFGGDDRKQWGKKTAEYGREVREKANRIQQLLGNQPMPDTVANDPGETAKEKGLPGAVAEKAQQLQQDISAITRPQQDEQEPGFLDNLSDLAKLGNLGLNMAAQDVRELVGRIPGVGKTIQSGLDYADYALSGKTSEDILNQTEQNTVKAMTPQMQEALQKQWWDDKTNSFGPAIKDWRSYVGGVVESLPEQVLTMGPSLKLAKAAYGAKIAAGAAPEVAAKAAAKAATIAGSITEGLLGGAQSGRSVRDEINALPDDVLAKSDAVKAMMKNGMSLDDARKQLAEDQGTQAFLTSGAITGLFGGMGDRTLAKIFSEAGGGAMKRALSGMAKEALSEGLFEEAPQSAGQQLSENLAMQPADNRKLTKDVLGQTIGGAILGAVQGGGMGAVGGLTGSHNQPESVPPVAASQGAPQPSPAPMPEPAPGPLSRAVQKTEANMPDEPASQSQQQPQPVTVTTPHGQTITGFMDSYHEDDNGNYVARVLGTDGQTYHFTNQDGVTIQPINTPKEAQEEQQKDSKKAPKEQQKSTVLPFDVDQETGEILEPKPAANASDEKAPAQKYDQMDEPELRQRLKYLTKQAKVSGWDKSLLNERRKVEGAINALNDAKNAQRKAAKSDSEPLTEHNEQPEQPKASSTASTGSMDDMLAAFDQEVSTTKQQSQETNNAEASNVQNEQPESAEVPQKQGDDNATPVQPDEINSATQQPGGKNTPGETISGSAEDVPAATATANTNPALNKDGTQKWFGSKPKALEYLTKKAIADTHEVRKNGRRWEIHEKEAPKEQQISTQELPAEQQSNAAVAPESEVPVTTTGEQNAVDEKPLTTKKAQQSAEIIGKPGDTVRVTSSGGEAQSGQTFRVDSIADNGDVSYTDPRSGYKGIITGKQLKKDVEEGAEYSSVKQPISETAQKSTQEAPERQQKNTKEAQKEQRKKTKTDTVKNEQQFADNKIFTADKVAAARARLKSKLGQLNSGIDPEMLVDGMTIAGAYIESGVRNFSDYANAMIDDLGDAVKPYLLSFYEGARNYPGLDTEGMTSVEEAKREHAALMTPQDMQTEAIGEIKKKPARRTKKTGSSADTTLTQDWGVDTIDGYGEGEREVGNNLKDAFLKDGSNYLKAVASQLSDQGFMPYDDRKGRPGKPVTVNEGGPAGSGEVSLTMYNPDTGVNAYIHIGDTSMRGTVPTTPSGIAIMYRTSNQEGDKFASGGGNRWAPVDLSATDLAKMVSGDTATTTKQENVNDTQPDTANAGESAPTVRTEPVPADEGERGTESVSGQPAERSGTKPGRSKAGSAEQQSTGRDEQPGAGSGQPVQSSGRDSAAERDRADSRPTSSAGNYRIERGELTRKGSWKETAERNVQIIELVNQLDKEGRYATDEEKSLLVQYTGMGASEIANSLFPDQYGRYKQGWEELGKRLKTALNKEQYEQASRTTQYAHYTSEGVIRSIYDAVSRLGFNGGMVMEPGMGTGHFIGMMPDAMTVDGQYTGIEYDYITSRIGHYLYPQANVINGDYTKTPLPRDYFDMAIGNPPFSSTKITNDPEYKKHGFMLHDYFFAKTIDRVKPGGLLVFVTSKGTLDKANSKLREYLAERSHFLGAVRLPQTAFKANAGTEVVTDVIFLKKLEKGETSRLSDWQALAINEVQTPQGPALINDYYVQHPEMVLGTHALTGSMYRKNEYTVEPVEGVDIEEAFAKAIQNLPENVYRPERGSSAERAVVRDRDFNPKHRKEGGLYVSDDGKLMQVNDGTGIELTQRAGTGGKLIDLKPKETAFLKAYTGLRDALKQAQYDQLNDGYWQESLKNLNDTYDNFVKDHGNLLAYSTIERTDAEGNTVTTKRFKNDPLLRLDAEGALAYALEKLKEDGTIAKGDVLNGRVLKRDEEPQIVTTQDAMFVSLNQLGRLDIDDIARLAGTDRDTVISDLGTAIYDHPGKGWVPADEYLSGNVVRKLKEAQAAAVSNPKYQRNVDALLAVQPRPLGPQEISVRLGANWIPPSDIEQFGKDVIGENVSVSYSPITGQWDVEQTGDNKSEYGFKAMSAGKILESTLNNRQIKITWRDQDGKTHVDTEATEKANDIAKKMRVAFSSWVWTDTKRSERLVNHYNDNFNNIVARQFDGSHLTLPGVSSRFKLYPHQKRAIWRTIQEGDSYYAHAVGAGKTFTMIAAGMEQKRLGLIDKPMYVVPNHMLAQFSREFLELYPTANIMVADEHNFHTHNRRRFVAQAALNNPDAIVITHSGFGRIAMSDAYYSNFIGEEIAKWKHALNEIEGDDDRITRKRIEKKIEGMERKLEGKQGKDKKDNVLNFEELGVDYLFVDEAHEFRKLDFVTNQGNVKGIDPNGSQRAQDLFMKVKYLREKSDRALTMASGTPVTNTMGELYTVQRFFQPDQMEEDGTDTFDAWASMYGDITAGFEQNAAGGYEVVSRFAKFQNVPELMSRVRSFMDILTSSNLGELVQRPTVEGGGRNVIVTPVPSGYKEYQKSLGDRITKIRNRKGRVQKGDDIILNVIADGRFSAIDMRFVDNAMPSDPNSKLNQLLDDMISAYDDTKDYEYTDANGKKEPLKGSSLMMFTDIGLGEQSAANRGFDMKAWITKRLTDAGIPREHIAFMRDFKEHAKKERLFADMRSGKKRILIGGKEMETGTNVQKRLSHLFHLDAPWFPASVEQREGRIIRQGNQNPKVIVKAYATKGSYDSTMWGMNARKAKFIEQAMNGDTSVRSLEDVSEASAFETAAALASGDERYMKLAGLRADVERLSRLHNAHYDDQNRLRRDKHQSQQLVSHASDYIAELNEAIAKRQPIKAGEFMAKVGKDSFDARDQFSTALFDAFRDKADAYTEDEQKLGEIGGFDIIFTGTTLKGSGQYVAELHVDIPGDPNPLIEYPISTDVAINGIATRAANQVNGLDKQLADAISTKEQNERRITQIDSRLGAPFPDEAELLEKMADVQALEDELTKEQLAEGGETANGEAAVATLEVDPEPAINSSVEQTEIPELEANNNDILHHLNTGRRKASPDAISDLEKATGSVNDEDGINKFIDLARKTEQSAGRGKGNNPQKVLATLRDAEQSGKYNTEGMQLAQWLIRRYQHLADTLDINLAQGDDDKPYGSYNVANRLITLFSEYRNQNGDINTPDTLTAVHEIMHHTERMLPADVQEHIAGMWLDALRDRLSYYNSTGQGEKAELLSDFVAGMYGDESAQSRGIQAILNGTLPASDYQFANPSEYWAENSSRIIAERKNSSWVKKAVAALRSIFDKIRSLLGIETPTTLDTALDSVLKGDGKLKSGRILAQVGDDLYQLSERFGGKSNMEKLSSPNFRSFAPKEKSAKGIPLNELKRIVDELKASYNGNIPLDIRAVENMEKAYGPNISEDVRNAKGAYHPRARAAVFAAANLLHARDVRETFRHEILGHYGLNTFTPEDKKDLLQKIVDTRKSPSLKPAWDFIDRNYANEPESVKAEEVFAHIAEKSDTYKNPDWREKVLNFLNKLVRKTGLSKRPLTLAELRETARAIAKGIRSGERVQQNFPQDDSAQFSKSSPAQKEPVVTAATESIDRDESRDWDSLGRIFADQSIGSRLFVHPRTIAAVHPEFTPVYKTAISQMETRDANVAELGEHVAGYDELTQPGKLQVNKVLELGRLLERNFSEDELKAGVETPASKKVASVDDEGKPVVVDVPLTPLLSKKGEVIKLSGAEAKAYTDLRNMFDIALDKFRDQVLEEYGFPELVGTKDAGRGILEMITPETPVARAETLTNMARFVSEIEQAKRTGYVPLARYGDYVVTVKEKIADLKFLGDSKDYDIVQGVTDEMAPRVQELGGEFDKKENGWRVPKSARPELKRMAEKTVYSERVETGMVGKWYERRGKTVEDVPEVKKAIAKARKDWVGDNKDRRIVAFKVKTKKPDEPVSLTDVDALASVANIDNATWDAIRDKLSDAIKGQGFRRHFFHSENIPGYTGDFERAISDYIIGMSGYLSRRAHMKRWDAAVSNIKDKGKLFNYASKYRDYVNSPQEEFTFLRQIGFLSYIAGVPATAFANLTQVPFLTMPTLSQIAPQALVGKEVARAYKDALAMFSPMRKKLEMFDPDKAPADVRDIMKKAWADGVFVPLESFERMLTASKPTAGRRKLARAVGTGTQGLSYLFTFAERLNRLVTYMAAARLANKRAVKENAHRVLKNDALAKSTVLGKNWSPENLAEWVVDESQFRMGKANRPEAMRGVGAAIMQFKSFMLQTFEAWYRMAKLHDKRGAMMMAASIAALMVMSGVWGLPGADDLRKLIEQVYKQMTDEDLDLKTELRGWIMRTSGSQVISQIVNKGITYPAGLDLTRVGMGTVAPDSSLGMLGIPADLIFGRTSRAVEKAATGDMLGAASEMAPNVIKNPLTALGWGKDGVRDKYGKVILPSNMLSTRDLVMKSLGFQPSIVTDVKDYEYAQRRQETAEDQLKRRYTTEIARNLANIERAENPEDKAEYEQELRDVFAQIKEHNDKATDPSQIIKISPRTIRGRVVQEMEGVKSTWGRERKQARGAAQDMRRQFGLEEEGQDK